MESMGRLSFGWRITLCEFLNVLRAVVVSGFDFSKIEERNLKSESNFCAILVF